MAFFLKKRPIIRTAIFDSFVLPTAPVILVRKAALASISMGKPSESLNPFVF